MPQLEQIRKAIVAFFGTGAGTVIVQVVAGGDFSTKDGLITAVVSALVGLGVWRAPNVNPA